MGSVCSATGKEDSSIRIKDTSVMAAPEESEYSTIGWALQKPWVQGGEFKPVNFPRGKVTDHDVRIDNLYCGVCHSDVVSGPDPSLTVAKPLIAGHEFIGKVLEVGTKVTKFKVGDTVGVGCITDCCKDCLNCDAGDEQYCLK